VKVSPDRTPPLSLVVPFLLAAPLGAVAAGIIATRTGGEIFVAINTPRLVAITHALVLGWIGATIMGSTYQLGPVVLGGRLLSTRLARIQFGLHACAVFLFVSMVLRWDTTWMAVAGVLLAISLSFYLVNLCSMVVTASRWGEPRSFLAVSAVFLLLAGAFGITWVGALEHAWFPVTFGRLAAHAHLGLVGWVGLTLMGVSYQLVPMFNVAPAVRPRFGHPALAVTAVATLTFASVMLFDPAAPVRFGLVLFLATGPLLWSIDQWRVVRGRNRRKLDIQGWSTIISLLFLVVAVLLGAGAALGTPLTPDDAPARWPLAYGAAAILGWAGTAVLGNVIKIHAFLVWLHRYRPRIGAGPVPLVSDLYSEAAARVALGVHVSSTLVIVVAALSGRLIAFHLGGLGLALGALLVLGILASMYAPIRKQSRRPRLTPELTS
jgi:hypothetical protein